mmetsp:Transcript_12830/g.34068  ORF Transcript_12830/g.34068 Transcript_12830/m.34068 type:complete len:200 (+) Transcript_12830:210-809(+)
MAAVVVAVRFLLLVLQGGVTVRTSPPHPCVFLCWLATPARACQNMQRWAAAKRPANPPAPGPAHPGVQRSRCCCCCCCCPTLGSSVPLSPVPLLLLDAKTSFHAKGFSGKQGSSPPPSSFFTKCSSCRLSMSITKVQESQAACSKEKPFATGLACPSATMTGEWSVKACSMLVLAARRVSGVNAASGSQMLAPKRFPRR